LHQFTSGNGQRFDEITEAMVPTTTGRTGPQRASMNGANNKRIDHGQTHNRANRCRTASAVVRRGKPLTKIFDGKLIADRSRWHSNNLLFGMTQQVSQSNARCRLSN
jgi:hypothetical protein